MVWTVWMKQAVCAFRSEGPSANSSVRKGGEMALINCLSAEGAPRFLPARSGLIQLKTRFPRPHGRGYWLTVLRTYALSNWNYDNLALTRLVIGPKTAQATRRQYSLRTQPRRRVSYPPAASRRKPQPQPRRLKVQPAASCGTEKT